MKSCTISVTVINLIMQRVYTSINVFIQFRFLCMKNELSQTKTVITVFLKTFIDSSIPSFKDPTFCKRFHYYT